MPAGVGNRAVYLMAGNQAPFSGAPYANGRPNWIYDALRVISSDVSAQPVPASGGFILPPGTISADGGTVVSLQVSSTIGSGEMTNDLA